VHRSVVLSTANPADLSKALAHCRGQLLGQTACGLGRFAGAVVYSDGKVVRAGGCSLGVLAMALAPCSS